MTVPSEMVPLVQLLAPHFLGGGWESHPSVLGLDAAVPLRSPGSAPVPWIASSVSCCLARRRSSFSRIYVSCILSPSTLGPVTWAPLTPWDLCNSRVNFRVILVHLDTPYLLLSATWCWLNQFPDSQKTLDSCKLTRCIPSVEFYVTRISDLTETQKLEFYPNPRTMPAFLLCICLPKKATHVITPGQRRLTSLGQIIWKLFIRAHPFLKSWTRHFWPASVLRRYFFFFSFSEALIPKEKKDKVEGRFFPCFVPGRVLTCRFLVGKPVPERSWKCLSPCLVELGKISSWKEVRKRKGRWHRLHQKNSKLPCEENWLKSCMAAYSLHPSRLWLDPPSLAKDTLLPGTLPYFFNSYFSMWIESSSGPRTVWTQQAFLRPRNDDVLGFREPCLLVSFSHKVAERERVQCGLTTHLQYDNE